MNTFFGLDIYVALKGIHLSIWEIKDLNVGGLNLTNANFANLNNQIRYIVTLKYYLKSLAQIAATITLEEN